MSDCDFDALESLAFDELAPARAEEARAHAASCPACAEELALLRAERGVFAERARASAPLPGFAAALARSRWIAAPAAAANAPPPVVKSRFPWAISALGVAAAAAFAGVFFLPPAGRAHLDPKASEPIAVEPADKDFCSDEASSRGITFSPKTAATCEMPILPCAADPGHCGACGAEAEPPAGIDTCEHDSCVTQACYSPLPD